MYLYFLLGFRLTLRVNDNKRRELLAENTVGYFKIPDLKQWYK